MPIQSPEPTISKKDMQFITRLRHGDEAAFMELVDLYHAPLLRLARMFVPTRLLAEDVVQETWIGVLKGIERFEGRSSLKTWIFRILMNIAKTRGQREARYIPFSSFDATEESEPSIDPTRFYADDEPGGGHWMMGRGPRRWGESMEERLLSQETRTVIDRAIEQLPLHQRAVITLRDIEGWDADEVCNILDVAKTNQRVLLHRARAKVRTAVEKYLSER